MGFKFGYFLKGATTTVGEALDKAEEDNAKYVADTVKKAAENYAATQKEAEKQKTELTGVIGSLASLEFAGGERLNDQQLIALASNPDAAKSLLEQIKKDPTVTTRVKPDFVKAINNIPIGKKPNEYIDELFARTKASDEAVKNLFSPKEDATFVQRWGAQRNLELAQRAANAYGVSLNDLYGKNTPASQRAQNNLQIRFNDFMKKDFNSLEDAAKVEYADALKTGDETKIKSAQDTLSRLAMAKAASDVAGRPEARIQSEMVTKIQDLQAKGTPEAKQEAANLTVQLRQRQQLLDEKGGKDSDKITVANLISVASKQLTNTLERSLPPGSYGLVKEDDGTVRPVLKNATPEQARIFNKAVYDADQFIIKAFTKEDGTVKDTYHQLALNSRGIAVDPQSGKPIPPSMPAEVPRPGATPAPTRPGEARQPAAQQPAAAASQPAAATAQPSASLAPTMTPVERATASLAEAVRSRDAMANNKNVTSAQKAEALNILDKEIAKLKEDIATLSRTGGAAKPAQQQQPAAGKVLKWNPQKQQWE